MRRLVTSPIRQRANQSRTHRPLDVRARPLQPHGFVLSPSRDALSDLHGKLLRCCSLADLDPTTGAARRGAARVPRRDRMLEPAVDRAARSTSTSTPSPRLRASRPRALRSALLASRAGLAFRAGSEPRRALGAARGDRPRDDGPQRDALGGEAAPRAGSVRRGGPWSCCSPRLPRRQGARAQLGLSLSYARPSIESASAHAGEGEFTDSSRRWQRFLRDQPSSRRARPTTIPSCARVRSALTASAPSRLASRFPSTEQERPCTNPGGFGPERRYSAICQPVQPARSAPRSTSVMRIAHRRPPQRADSCRRVARRTTKSPCAPCATSPASPSSRGGKASGTRRRSAQGTRRAGVPTGRCRIDGPNSAARAARSPPRCLCASTARSTVRARGAARRFLIERVALVCSTVRTASTSGPSSKSAAELSPRHLLRRARHDARAIDVFDAHHEGSRLMTRAQPADNRCVRVRSAHPWGMVQAPGYPATVRSSLSRPPALGLDGRHAALPAA